VVLDVAKYGSAFIIAGQAIKEEQLFAF